MADMFEMCTCVQCDRSKLVWDYQELYGNQQYCRTGQLDSNWETTTLEVLSE